ncbi:MAG: hypothetical protein WDA23_09025 [Gemmobacter sp.]
MVRIGAILPRLAPVDLLLVTGDLTDLDRAQDYRIFREMLAPLDLRLAVVPAATTSARRCARPSPTCRTCPPPAR